VTIGSTCRPHAGLTGHATEFEFDPSMRSAAVKDVIDDDVVVVVGTGSVV
jgi:hypothetical protein